MGKHERTLQAIFESPTKANIQWREIEALFRHLGATIAEGRGARVRVAWVAEDVGDLVEPNFIIDETESVAPAPDTKARFTLARPPDGWAEGKYRVEFYVNDELEEMVRVTIVK